MATQYMGIVLPQEQVTVGPTWATMINDAFSLVDAHNHDTVGIKLTQDSLNITDDLDLNGNVLSSVKGITFDNNSVLSSSIPTATFWVDRELYFKDGIGNVVQVTSNGNINTSGLGAISGMTPTDGSVSYSIDTFSFFKTTSPLVYAAIVCGNLSINTLSAVNINTTAAFSASTILIGSHVTLTATGSVYTLTLPSSPPTTNSVLQSDASGNMSFTSIPTTTSLSANTLSCTDITANTLNSKSVSNILYTLDSIQGSSYAPILSATVGTATLVGNFHWMRQGKLVTITGCFDWTIPALTSGSVLFELPSPYNITFTDNVSANGSVNAFYDLWISDIMPKIKSLSAYSKLEIQSTSATAAGAAMTRRVCFVVSYVGAP
jgi:hypothetical protein